jgi:hypothetical protein
MEKLELLDGQYTVIYDPKTELISEVLRHGKEWRTVHGDNLIHALFWKVLELNNRVDSLSLSLKPMIIATENYSYLGESPLYE